MRLVQGLTIMLAFTLKPIKLNMSEATCYIASWAARSTFIKRKIIKLDVFFSSLKGGQCVKNITFIPYSMVLQ